MTGPAKPTPRAEGGEGVIATPTTVVGDCDSDKFGCRDPLGEMGIGIGGVAMLFCVEVLISASRASFTRSTQSFMSCSDSAWR